jgi:hypothetical protein
VQLRFAHRPLQAQQQAIVEVSRIVNTVLVENQRAGERSEFQQTMPVGIVARQAGYLQAEYDARVTQRYFADQMLESVAVLGVCAGDTQVSVDRVDTVYWPPEGDRTITQRVLALAALRVLEHLTQRGLANIQECIPPQVIGADLLMCINRHASPPSASARPCWQVDSRARDRLARSMLEASTVDVWSWSP